MLINSIIQRIFHKKTCGLSKPKFFLASPLIILTLKFYYPNLKFLFWRFIFKRLLNFYKFLEKYVKFFKLRGNIINNLIKIYETRFKVWSWFKSNLNFGFQEFKQVLSNTMIQFIQTDKVAIINITSSTIQKNSNFGKKNKIL